MEKNSYNPDVLNCIANLSNDEVFTPPAVANRMLDLVPQELFSNPAARFLDPFCKSGVFLREIVKRLDIGLAEKIPDREERIAHIMHNQVYGIAITELTSLLARRTVYCCKDASGEHSVVRFDTPEGNIRFRAMRHTWRDGRCIYCGASQEQYERGEGRESYAYQFIHTEKPKNIFKMDFDVIIGNPPYQLSDGSGASSDAAMPIYQKFIIQALKLKPRYLSMIVPSKWMIGGRGLQQFREEMLADKHICRIVDFENSADCFPGLHIDGGVCYFLWDNTHKGDTDYSFITKNNEEIRTVRPLSNPYFQYVIRDSRIFSILEKTQNEQRFSTIVSATKPFGIRKYLFNEPERYPTSNLSDKEFPNSVKIYGVKGIKGGARRKVGYVSKSIICASSESIEKYKIFFTTSYSADAIEPPEAIIAGKNEVCTETFLMIGPFNTEQEQKNCYSYMQTGFFKVLLYLGKGTMQVTRTVFGLIPLQDFSKPWTDEELYAKYGLTEEEIRFIESMIRPMED